MLKYHIENKSQYILSADDPEMYDYITKIDSEMNDALKIFEKSEFGTDHVSKKPTVIINPKSQYTEIDSFSSEDPVLDDMAKVVHKGLLIFEYMRFYWDKLY